METTVLQGIYDLHIHTAPDVVPRKCDDNELADRLFKAGMAGFAIKAHFTETASRVALLRQRYPSMKIVGGITLNRQAGGINPDAAEYAARLGAKFVWFPTMHSLSYQVYHHGGAEVLPSGISLFDENGTLLSQVHDILDIAAAHHMIIATGHISASEGLALSRAAVQQGVSRVVITHCDNPADYYSVEQQLECVRLGAVLEHCYYTTARGYTPPEEIKRQIRAVGCENVILSSDLGQTDLP